MTGPADAKASERRATKDDLELNPDAHAFLASLDPQVRPNELAAKFPRIVNRIAQLWRYPAQMDKYFDDLLVIERRDPRKGFPLQILMELSALKEHYHTKTFPTAKSIWDQS
jgi:hypothetical protein